MEHLRRKLSGYVKKSYRKILMSSKIKVLAVVPEIYDKAPGQRFRIEQWEPYLRELGVEITYLPFEDEKLRSVVNQPGRYPEKFVQAMKALGRRRRGLSSLADYDLVYVFREAALLGPAIFERSIVRAGKPMIFDFDDAVFLRSAASVNGYLNYLKFPGKIKTVCRLASHVMAGNSFLAEFAGEVNKNVTVVPTTIDINKYHHIYPEKEAAAVPTIVWSGSRPTLTNLFTLRPALQKLASEEKFKLRVIGTPAYELPGVEVEAFAWRSETEVDDLKSGDIGIMPLPDDTWSRGKCGLKALQYMALGIPTICSAVGANMDIIRDGENGFLASSDDEWIAKLKTLLHSAEDRNRLGRAGRETVEEKFSAQVQAPRVYEIFASVVN
jgi:glycosyltransferase involved in cell wall biosynthesis